MKQDGVAEASISVREAEVLAAVGEHLTNAEIATRLFISIRTVESHVSSLLRKFGASDRRALSLLAAQRSRDPAPSGDTSRRVAPLPSPLTSFVGRTSERAELAAALSGPRLVTAVGPGGVGKTRLALAVAADVSGRFADGVWYADLVPVSDPLMVASAVAGAIGLGEQQGRSTEDTVLAWAADRQALFVLDNCEHLLDGVALLVERLLARSPGLVVLATSRARLLLPFERVVPVAGMSVPVGDDAEGGDATTLFEERAAAAGFPVTAADRSRIARICRGLDGVPLAIELAAARLPSLGVDGLEAGLADRLQLLTGARRVDSRHSSLRSMLDWSYALLDEQAQAVLRRAAVFAGPFRAEDAAAVAGWAPVAVRDIGVHLAALADHSLLVPTTASDGTRYRVLEAVRQYGAELLEDTGELVECRARHLRWSGEAGAALLADTAVEAVGWRTTFDRLADELRATLAWFAPRPEHRQVAYEGKGLLAALCHRRGLSREAQWRYEQAAALAPDDARAAVALHMAAGAAEAQLAGEEAVRLRRAAAAAALRADEPERAARELAQAAELMNRGPGTFAHPASPDVVRALLDEARRHAGGDLVAQARLATAEAFVVPETDPGAAQAGERALELARRAGDRLAESAALDRLTTVQLAGGEARAALASALRRIELLAPVALDADAGFELSDAHIMAVESAIAAGDLREARRVAERVRDLPLHREVGHVAVARLLTVALLDGHWDGVVAAGERFREGWERAGRPRVPTLRRAAHAVATVHGLRGEDDSRATWMSIFNALEPLCRPLHDKNPRAFFDALVLLHLDQPDEALRLLAVPPDEIHGWYQGIWRPWYGALWVEAAVLADQPAAAERASTVRPAIGDNPVAAAIVDRAAALAAGDRAGVLAAARALEAAGCRYQWARSLVLAGGAERARGESALRVMGATLV
ncbi:ATP-binding protein [Pseudonocardia xinjiangensis]|uniref:ATPase n=1 Tax=Pseudonocardia xinjiangensis TaxID=75289 RepID=A0ABX1R979_9PSEU|nr:LuxR C-terminal-related transcriptional regulator [Pseudonocardia xinjiangensis]NMH76937.1 ATPase [Pseudonocardia xinjiangensis]